MVFDEYIRKTVLDVKGNFRDERAKYLFDLIKSQMLESGLDIYDVKTFIDIGCGNGTLTYYFNKYLGAEFAVGLDIDRKLIDEARSLKSSHIRLIWGDGACLPFRDESVNCITLFSIFEHVEDQNRLLQEAHRILKKDGLLIMQIPNKYFPIELHTGMPLINFSSKLTNEYAKRTIGYQVHLQSRREIMHVIGNSNFKIKSCRGYMYFDDLVPSGFKFAVKILKTLRFFELFPYGFIVICQK